MQIQIIATFILRPIICITSIFFPLPLDYFLLSLPFLLNIVDFVKVFLSFDVFQEIAFFYEKVVKYQKDKACWSKAKEPSINIFYKSIGKP